MKQFDFKNVIIVATVGLGLMGCAQTAKKSATIKSSKYTKRVTGENLDRWAAGGAFSCPNRRRSWKNESWKKIIELANNCVRKEKWQSVEEMGDHLSQAHHQGPWGAYYLSLAAEAKGNHARALWMIDLALKKAPDIGILHYQKGRVHWSLKEYKAGMDSFKSAINSDKDLIEAHVFIGQVYLRDQDYKQAEEHFEKVLKFDDGHRIALAGLAESHQYQGEYGQALDVLTQAILKFPRTLEYRLRAATIYEVNNKNYVQALDSYRKIKSLLKQKRLEGQISFNLDQKIKSLETLVGKTTPGATVSQNSSGRGGSTK